jgi:hypothetical protein
VLDPCKLRLSGADTRVRLLSSLVIHALWILVAGHETSVWGLHCPRKVSIFDDEAFVGFIPGLVMRRYYRSHKQGEVQSTSVVTDVPVVILQSRNESSGRPRDRAASSFDTGTTVAAPLPSF